MKVAMIAWGLGLSILSGCETTSRIDAGKPTYPAMLSQERTLDIQVVRDGTSITLTNTTAQAFGKSRLWINRWYSREIDSFAVGQTVTLSLNDFKDAYGEPFRAGGFFATRKPDRVVLVQIETEGRLLGFVSVSDKNE